MKLEIFKYKNIVKKYRIIYNKKDKYNKRKKGRNDLKKMLKNKSKVIISIILAGILVVGILSMYLKSNTEIISLAGNWFQAMNANVVQKTVGSGLESAYIEWESVDGATGYNAYIRSENTNHYEQLDNELIRRYKDGTSSYWRADAVGLKAGQYVFKVVPIVDGKEDTSKQLESETIIVQAHDRTGFAWVDGETTGAYNIDGTLKENANILYITEETKDTVSLEVQTSSSGKTETAQGLQNILNLYKKGYDETPLVIRVIGKVTDPATLDGGDIVISGNSSDKRINCGITLEGIGEDATLYGYGIRIKNATNVEVRNIAVMLTDSSEGDNIGLQQENDHIWVHNCDFFYGEAGSDSDQAKGDGALDCKKSTYVTFSYNHFWDSGKSNLLGLSEDTTDGLYITYHHNWYDHSDSRHPRIRFYSAHVYNNYYDGNSKYGVGACLGSSVLVEGNYFRNCKKPMMISMQGSDTSGTFSKEDGGMIKAYNNYMIGQDSYIPYSQDNENFDAYEVSNIDETVPSSVKSLQGENTYNNFDTSSIMYEYEADSPEVARQKVETYAGRLNGGDFKWEFNDTEDDESDSLNKELKEALENYETDLLSVGGNSIESPEQPDPEPEEIPVEGVTLNAQNLTLNMGETSTLEATIIPDNATNKNVTWISENENIASVDNGVVTTIGEGETTITVITEDGEKTATCNITVLPNEDPEEIPVEEITLNTQNVTLEIGETSTLEATIIPDNATNKNVTWTSENENIASVDNGVVTAIGEGKTTITVITEDGEKTATCNITVLPNEDPEEIPVEEITLNTQNVTLEIGETSTLEATIIPDNATNKNVTWTSENENIASVDNGVVTAIGEGETTITVATEDGEKTAKCVVTVIEPGPEEIHVEKVELNLQDISLEIGETATLVAVITPNDATNKNVTWTSEDENIASVNNGVVTAIGPGETTITVTTEDGQKTATCKITVTEEEEELISTISYDYTELTNQNVTATITFNKEDVTITNNEGNNEYVFEENGTFTFEYMDSEGNASQNIARVTWIDKEGPQININYETINNGKAVQVTIQANEELEPIEDWTLSEDRLSISKIFYENQTENIQLSDLAGNVVETTIVVQNIEEPGDETQNNTNTTNTITGNTNNYQDDTVANTILPSAGLSTFIKVLIAIVVLGTIGFYIRYRYLRNIIK